MEQGKLSQDLSDAEFKGHYTSHHLHHFLEAPTLSSGQVVYAGCLTGGQIDHQLC